MWEFLKNPRKYFSPEARAERERNEQLRESWKKNPRGTTFDEYKKTYEEEGRQIAKWNEEYANKVRQRTQRCIAACQMVLELAPQTTPRSPRSHLNQLREAMGKLNWIGSFLDLSNVPNARLKNGVVVDDHDPTLKELVEPVAKTLWQIRRHPNADLQREIEGVLEKLTCRYDFIGMANPEINAYRTSGLGKYGQRNWGSYKPHEVE